VGIVFRGVICLAILPNYEAILKALSFALWWLRVRIKRPERTAVFLLAYGIILSVVELFREPDPQLGFIAKGLTMGQILCHS
jgi:phosphatidylglycerol:prolipoprotein diacylglycerol transferase